MKIILYFFMALIAMCLISKLAFLLTNLIDSYNSKLHQKSSKSFSNNRNIDITTKILSNSNNFYLKKDSCMTPNESRMFFYITCALDEIFSLDKRKNYYIFPQASLHSFIGTTSKNLSKFEHSAALNNLLRKNVDFLICKCVWKKQYTKGTNGEDLFFFAYEPILIIELDGSSHIDESKYGINDFIQQKRSDAFKKSLSLHLQLPLINYLLSNDRIEVSDRKKIKDMITTILI